MNTCIRRYCLLLLLPLLIAPVIASEPEKTATQLTLEDLRTFTDIFDQLRRNYVEEIDDRTLLRGAINGMLGELDPYSSFIDAEEFRNLDDSSRGRRASIGAQVVIQDQRLVIDSVHDGAPAAQAGIQPGDILIAVDGEPVRGRKLAISLEALDGNSGSEVRLRVLTPGAEPRDVTLTRAWVPVASVVGEWLAPGYAHMRVTHFHVDTAEEFQRQLERLRDNSGEVRGLLLDLRQNRGGVLRAAVGIADGLLDEGLIVHTRGRYAATRLEYKAHPGQWFAGVPVAVLIDGGTASSSEVLAGALQDHGRATLFGSQSYGKGSIQSVLRLHSGAALRLTTALYYTPSGRSLQGRGIEPDVVTAADEDAALVALEWLRRESG